MRTTLLVALLALALGADASCNRAFCATATQDAYSACLVAQLRAIDDGAEPAEQVLSRLAYACPLELDSVAHEHTRSWGPARALEAHEFRAVLRREFGLRAIEQYRANSSPEEKAHQAEMASKREQERADWNSSLQRTQRQLEAQQSALTASTLRYFQCAKNNAPLLDDRLSDAAVIAEGVKGACRGELYGSVSPQQLATMIIEQAQPALVQIVLQQRMSDKARPRPAKTPPARPLI